MSNAGQAFFSVAFTSTVKLLSIILGFADFLFGYHPNADSSQITISSYIDAFNTCQAPFSLLSLILGGTNGIVLALIGLVITIIGVIGFFLSVTRVPREILGMVMDSFMGVVEGAFSIGGSGMYGRRGMSGRGLGSRGITGRGMGGYGRYGMDGQGMNATTSVILMFIGIFLFVMASGNGGEVTTITDTVGMTISGLVMIVVSMLVSAAHTAIAAIAELIGITVPALCAPTSTISMQHIFDMAVTLM